MASMSTKAPIKPLQVFRYFVFFFLGQEWRLDYTLQRNAIRLNGTAKTSTSNTTRSQTHTTTQATQTHSSSATQAMRWGGFAVAPLLLALLVL